MSGLYCQKRFSQRAVQVSANVLRACTMYLNCVAIICSVFYPVKGSTPCHVNIKTAILINFCLHHRNGQLYAKSLKSLSKCLLGQILMCKLKKKFVSSHLLLPILITV